ncbi:MAG: GNAT family N-acetyltransferase [Acidimicrobiales bacterium]
MTGDTVRTATLADAPAMAEVLVAARRAMTYLPLIHTDDRAAPFLSGLVTTAEVAVVERGALVIAFAVVDDRWLAHLYVHPRAQNQGVGTRLIGWAKQRSPGGLDLWVFARNAGARRLYAAHGWRDVLSTEGDNEEGQPDVKMRWDPAG